MKAEEDRMGDITGWKFKLVERSGVLLKELLTKANPWKEEVPGMPNGQKATKLQEEESNV